MDPVDDGARMLAPLRDAEPAGASTVDVAKAVRVGTRRRRTRQAVSVAAAVAVVAVVLAIVPAVLSGRNETAPANPVAGFDLLSQRLTVGSAGGFTPVSYETGRYRQQVRLVPAPDSPQGTPETASVTAYASGRADRPVGDERAPDVYGKRAFWSSGTSGTELAWEWARDAWVFVHVDGTGEHARELAHRVAQAVRTDADTAVRVPFTIAPPGGGLEVVGVITPYGTSTDPYAGALLVLGSHDSPGTEDRVLVGVLRDPAKDLVTGGSREVGPSNTQLGGQQATVTETAVSIFDVDTWVAVAESAAGGSGVLIPLAESVTVVEDSGNRGAWSADPVR